MFILLRTLGEIDMAPERTNNDGNVFDRISPNRFRETEAPVAYSIVINFQHYY